MKDRVAATRVHYAWVIAAVTFLVLLVSAGIRATAGVLIVPLEQEFGWSRAIISLSIAINIALFGLIGPFAASVMDRFGLRRIILLAIALLGGAVALSTRMHTQWQLMILWGVLVGAGSGVTSMVLAAVVATRWFDERRGLVLGALSAANATGQLVFLPALARVIEHQRMAARDVRRGLGGRRNLRGRPGVHARSTGGHGAPAIRRARRRRAPDPAAVICAD